MAAIIASISQMLKLKQKGLNNVPKQVVQPGSQTPGLGSELTFLLSPNHGHDGDNNWG